MTMCSPHSFLSPSPSASVMNGFIGYASLLSWGRAKKGGVAPGKSDPTIMKLA